MRKHTRDTKSHLENRRRVVRLLPTTSQPSADELQPYTKQRLVVLKTSIRRAESLLTRLRERLDRYEWILAELAGPASELTVSLEAEGMIAEHIRNIQDELDKLSALYPLRKVAVKPEQAQREAT